MKDLKKRTTKNQYNAEKKDFIRKNQAKYNSANRKVVNQRQAEYNSANMEVINQRQAEYDSTNREAINQRQAEYNSANKGVINQRQAEYNSANMEVINQRQAEYDSTNREAINQRQAEYNSANKGVINQRQAEYNSANRGVINKRQAEYNSANRGVINKRQAEYNSANMEVINKRQAVYNSNNNVNITATQSVKRKKAKREQTAYDRFQCFKEDIKDGPSWICCSCHRRLFKKSVRLLKDSDIDYLIDLQGVEFVSKSLLPQHDQENFVCHNCFKLIRSGKLPSISVFNALSLDDIPDELNLTELEVQLIAKTILFMKIRMLPKTRMGAIVDRVINVPLEDDDIVRTVQSFPRLLSESAVLPVKFKRMKTLTNAYMEAFVRPQKLIDAVLKLQELGHPHYLHIKIKDEYKQLLTEDLKEILQLDTGAASEEENSDGEQSDSEKDPVKRQQVNDSSHTCMVHEDPASMVVVNSSSKPVSKKTNRKSDKSYVVAPGEGKTPTNWMREHDFDVKAYPHLHPKGRFGVNCASRKFQLSCQQYFTQRLLNKDQRFARCKGYLFMAQQYIERNQLERQIDVAGTKGKPGISGSVSLTDPFSIFVQIRGSPKYWQKVRYELMAKLEQLGPFQLFFTLSCGELRWSEVFVAMFKEQDVTVTYMTDDVGQWNGSDETILINNQPLWEYIEAKNINKSNLLREEVLHVTRMFENRVKSFIKNILLSQGVGTIPVAFFSYRVEFQARGKII
jgi:hypothetical protein